LLAVAEHLDIHSDLIPRIATGFCSGLARTGGMCGAVSGGIMAIGLSLGRTKPTDDIDPCYQAVRIFLGRFSIQFTSLSCLELTGVHLDTPEGHAAFRAKGQIRNCTVYVGEATRMVVEIVGSKGY
jgi:C_GCAxxG_C_C family probable redox protein